MPDKNVFNYRFDAPRSLDIYLTESTLEHRAEAFKIFCERLGVDEAGAIDFFIDNEFCVHYHVFPFSGLGSDNLDGARISNWVISSKGAPNAHSANYARKRSESLLYSSIDELVREDNDLKGRVSFSVPAP